MFTLCLFLAILLVTWRLYEFLHQAQCAHCEGKGRHKDDCPLRKR